MSHLDFRLEPFLRSSFRSISTTNGIQEYLGSTFWNFSISSASWGKNPSFPDTSGHISCGNLVDQKDYIAGSKMTIAFLKCFIFRFHFKRYAILPKQMIHNIQRSFILGILRGMVIRSLEVRE